MDGDIKMGAFTKFSPKMYAQICNRIGLNIENHSSWSK
jgi:hypothetical protein